MRLPVVILLLFVATLPLATTTTTTTTTATRRRHQTERRIRKTHINRGGKTEQLKREEEEEMEKTVRTQMIREEEEEEDRRKGEEKKEKQEEVEVVVTRLTEEEEREEEQQEEEMKRRRRIRLHINTEKEEEKQEEEEIALVTLKEEKEEEEQEEEEENQEEAERRIIRRHTNRDREKEDGKRAKREREEEKKKEEEEEVAVVSLKVPQYVPKGHDAELECLWRVPRLYSVKWYHNDRELYGYKPSEAPTTTLYPLPGIRVDRARSTGALLVLAGVGVGAAGRYKCEVIGEAPGFLTADRSAVMRVVHIPKEPPSIQGTQPQYRVGQRVHLSCVSPPARPPASLTWYINDRQASPEYVSGLNTTTIWGDGLLETHAGLALTLQPSHFDARGQLRFRCAASIPGLYHKVRQHTIGAPPPLPPSLSPPLSPSSPSSYNVKAPVMESRDSAAAAASCATSVSAYGGRGISRSAVLLPLLSLLTLLLSFSLS